MKDTTREVMLIGLRQGVLEATANLYRVFTSPDRGADHEKKFLRGIEKHVEDYERAIELLTQAGKD